jgi:hypothetical protein
MRNKAFSLLRLFIVLVSLGVQLSCNSPDEGASAVGVGSNSSSSGGSVGASATPDTSLNQVIQAMNQSLSSSPQYQISSGDIQLLQSEAELSEEEIQELVLLVNQ